jgi:hypothetical protein
MIDVVCGDIALDDRSSYGPRTPVHTAGLGGTDQPQCKN